MHTRGFWQLGTKRRIWYLVMELRPGHWVLRRFRGDAAPGGILMDSVDWLEFGPEFVEAVAFVWHAKIRPYRYMPSVGVQ